MKKVIQFLVNYVGLFTIVERAIRSSRFHFKAVRINVFLSYVFFSF